MVNILLDALRSGDLNTVKSCGDISNVWISWCDCYQTPMHVAMFCGQFQVLDFLLTNFPKMVTKQTTDSKKTVLHDAVENGDICLVKKLVLVSTDLIDICDALGDTPLQYAVTSRKWLIASYMMSQKPESVNQTTDRGDTLLHCAIKCHDVNMVRGLLTMCPVEMLTTTNGDKHTPLYLALRITYSLDFVKPLIDANPRAIDIPDAVGFLPIFEVTTINLLTYLLAVCPVAIHHKTPMTNDNLLHAACRRRSDTQFTNTLLQLCPSSLLYEKNMNGKSPLHIACHNCEKHVNTILRYKPDLIDTDTDGNTILHMAVGACCDLDVVLAVFQNCPSNLHLANTNNRTPLCIAVETCNKDVVEMFKPHMTADMAVFLNDVCVKCCNINLKDYAAKQCDVVLNNHLLPDITNIVLEYGGINKKRKR